MKSAKSYKFIILICAFVMSLCACFFTMGTSNTVYGASASKPLDYFGVTNGDVTVTRELSFKSDSMVATVQDGDVLSLKRKLVVNDFAVVYGFENSDSFSKIIFRIKTDSFFVNGNKNTQENTFDKEIVIEKELDLSASEKIVAVAISNGVVSINGDSFSDEYYRVEAIDKTVASVEFEFKLSDNTTSADFSIISVDQAYTTGNKKFEQLFTVDSEGNLNDNAYPRIEINNDVFVKAFVEGENGAKDDITNQLKLIKNDINQFTFTSYSVLGDVAASAVYLQKTDSADNSVGLNNVEKPKKIQFREVGTKSFAVTYSGVASGEVLESYNVVVVDALTDNNAPYYKAIDVALEGFVNALNKAVKGADGTSIYLGAKLELPSMSDLVFDDVKSYSKLTATINYSIDDSATAQSDSFTIKKTGDYKFFVTFSDGTNAIETKDFYTVDENDSNIIKQEKYFGYIFGFKIIDDHDILIEVSDVDGLGYKGVKYTATKFKIDAEGCTTSYKLYYSDDTKASIHDEDAWIEIPALSKVNKNDTFEDGVTYSLIENTDYDGTLTFNPTKIGSYKIVCTVTSAYTTRSSEEALAIRVLDKATNIEFPNYWLRDNVWSVVFLSIGTLSLIGIIVLLCIKPKDETESD